MEIHDCEQGSEAWHQLRLGIPTASEFSKLLTPAKLELSKQIDAYAATLAAEAWTSRNVSTFTGNDDTDRGNALEDEAREFYLLEAEQPMELEKVGFITNEWAGLEDSPHGAMARAGCSPDALVRPEKRGKGISQGGLEIKCLAPKAHVLVLEEIEKNHGQVPRDYLCQVHGNMLITGLSWWHTYFYSRDLPTRRVHTNRNPEIAAKLVAGINAVSARRDELLAVLEAA